MASGTGYRIGIREVTHYVLYHITVIGGAATSHQVDGSDDTVDALGFSFRNVSLSTNSLTEAILCT